MSSGQFGIRGCRGRASPWEWAERGGADNDRDRVRGAPTPSPAGPDCARADRDGRSGTGRPVAMTWRPKACSHHNAKCQTSSRRSRWSGSRTRLCSSPQPRRLPSPKVASTRLRRAYSRMRAGPPGRVLNRIQHSRIPRAAMDGQIPRAPAGTFEDLHRAHSSLRRRSRPSPTTAIPPPAALSRRGPAAADGLGWGPH